MGNCAAGGAPKPVPSQGVLLQRKAHVPLPQGMSAGRPALRHADSGRSRESMLGLSRRSSGGMTDEAASHVSDEAVQRLMEAMDGDSAYGSEGTCLALDDPMYGAFASFRDGDRRRASRLLEGSRAAQPKIFIDDSACRGADAACHPPPRDGAPGGLELPLWEYEAELSYRTMRLARRKGARSVRARHG